MDLVHAGRAMLLALARYKDGGWGYALSGLGDKQEPISGSWPSVRGVGVPVHDLRKLIGQRAEEMASVLTVFDGDLDDPSQVSELRCRLIFTLAGRAVVVREVIHQATRAALARRDPAVAAETPRARALAVLRACSAHRVDAAPVPSVDKSAPRREDEALLTRAMLRKVVPVSAMTIWRWCHADTFPKPVTFNGRIYWRLSEVQAWIDARSVERATQVGSSRQPKGLAGENAA